MQRCTIPTPSRPTGCRKSAAPAARARLLRSGALLLHKSAGESGVKNVVQPLTSVAGRLYVVSKSRQQQIQKQAREQNLALCGLCRRQSMAEDAALRGEAVVQAAVRSSSVGLDAHGLPPPHPSAPDALRAAYAAATEAARPGGFSWGGPAPTAQAGPAAGGGLRKAHRSDNGAGIR